MAARLLERCLARGHPEGQQQPSMLVARCYSRE